MSVEHWSGATRDVITLIEQAHARGAESVDIVVKDWRVKVTWPARVSSIESNRTTRAEGDS